MHLIPLAQLLGVCSSNQFLVAHWRECQRLLDQSLKQQPARSRGSSVEPERELVRIVIQMRRRHGSLMRAQQPPLQERRHMIGSGQQVVSHHGTLPHHRMPVAYGLECRIAAPSVGQHLAARTHRRPRRLRQSQSRGISHRVSRMRPILPPSTCAAISTKPCPQPRARVCRAVRRQYTPRLFPPCR